MRRMIEEDIREVAEDFRTLTYEEVMEVVDFMHTCKCCKGSKKYKEESCPACDGTGSSIETEDIIEMTEGWIRYTRSNNRKCLHANLRALEKSKEKK